MSDTVTNGRGESRAVTYFQAAVSLVVVVAGFIVAYADTKSHTAVQDEKIAVMSEKILTLQKQQESVSSIRESVVELSGQVKVLILLLKDDPKAKRQ